MADRFVSAAEVLQSRLAQHASRTVTYHRGGRSVSLSASVGQTRVEETDEAGVLTEFESRDYLFAAADLVLAGQPITPEPGDVIRETSPGGTTVSEYVVRPAGVDPAWHYSDRSRVRIRVRTKLVREWLTTCPPPSL